MADNNTRTAAEYLREAARMIDAACVVLNSHSRRCGCCGRRNADNPLEAKIFTMIHETPSKLRGRAQELERASKSNPAST